MHPISINTERVEQAKKIVTHLCIFWTRKWGKQEESWESGAKQKKVNKGLFDENKGYIHVVITVFF